MDSFRAPFFWLALFALVLAVLVELGSLAVLHGGGGGAGVSPPTPGWSIRYLAIIDLVLLFGATVIGLGSVLPRAVVGRLQGVVALVLSAFGCLGAIGLAFLAFGLLVLMVSLLVIVPFGTLAYMAAWAGFPAGEAQATLALIMFLKLAFCVLLLLAQQRFLANKGLVTLTALSLGATWLASFLIAFPPQFLRSITDVVAALVIAIVGIIWLLLLAISSLLNLISVARSARTDRAT
jgi:hypothetical protein